MVAVAVSERLFFTALAVHVEPVGVGKDFFVAVAGLGCGDDAFACFDVLEARVNKSERVLEDGNFS